MWLARLPGIISAVQIAAAGGAAPTFQSAASAFNDSTTNSITVTKPSGTVDGDFLIAAVCWGNSGWTISPPAGWSTINHANGVETTVGVFWKEASGEGANFTFTKTSTQKRVSAFVARYTGHAASPIDVSGAGNGESTGPDCPDVTTTVGNTRVLRIATWGKGSSNQTADPPGTTGRISENGSTNNGGTGVALADEEQASAGATGTAAHTLDGSEPWRCLSVVIAPA